MLIKANVLVNVDMDRISYIALLLLGQHIFGFPQHLNKTKFVIKPNLISLQINVQTFLPDQEERVARRLVIPDNRAIKNLKGESEANSKSFPGLRRRKISADLSLSLSCKGGSKRKQLLTTIALVQVNIISLLSNQNTLSSMNLVKEVCIFSYSDRFCFLISP